MRSALGCADFEKTAANAPSRGRERPWTLLMTGMNCVVSWKMRGKGSKLSRLWQ